MVRTPCRPSTAAAKESAEIGWTSSWPGFGTTSSPGCTGPGTPPGPAPSEVPVGSTCPPDGETADGRPEDGAGEDVATPPEAHAPVVMAIGRMNARARSECNRRP